jgi:hypothetical protein
MPSDLPIIRPDPPPRDRTQAEKYGSLFYLAVAGLGVVVGLVTWFGVGLFRISGMLGTVYVIHDETRSEADRVAAAHALASDPRANPRELYDIALRVRLPDAARLAIAEAVPASVARNDPRGYALAVARSPGWPSWLRLALMRPITSAALDGVTFPADALAEISNHADPWVRPWAWLAIAVGADAEGKARARLEQDATSNESPTRELSALLIDRIRDRQGVSTDRTFVKERALAHRDHAATAAVVGQDHRAAP